MPTTEHRDGDYFAAVNRIASETRAANTPQIGSISVTYELHGSEPTPIEMDERSKRGLALSSATLSPTAARSPIKRESSRASSLGLPSDTL